MRIPHHPLHTIESITLPPHEATFNTEEYLGMPRGHDVFRLDSGLLVAGPLECRDDRLRLNLGYAFSRRTMHSDIAERATGVRNTRLMVPIIGKHTTQLGVYLGEEESRRGGTQYFANLALSGEIDHETLAIARLALANAGLIMRERYGDLGEVDVSLSRNTETTEYRYFSADELIALGE